MPGGIAGKGGLYDDRGDGMADGGWRGRLRRLSPVQWLGLTAVTGLFAAVVVCGLLTAVTGTMEAVGHLRGTAWPGH